MRAFIIEQIISFLKRRWSILITIFFVCVAIFLFVVISHNKTQIKSFVEVNSEVNLSSCGNGICEDYELLATCRKDCK